MAQSVDGYLVVDEYFCSMSVYDMFNNIFSFNSYIFFCDSFPISLKGSTVVIAYKNIVGSREKCSYNRYVLITDIYDL